MPSLMLFTPFCMVEQCCFKLTLDVLLHCMHLFIMTERFRMYSPTQCNIEQVTLTLVWFPDMLFPLVATKAVPLTNVAK